MTTKTAKRAAAASAVAAMTAASVLVGGLFDAPSEFLDGDAAPGSAYFDTLLDGGDGGDGDGDADGQEPGETRRRGLRAGLRERILRLPLAVRMLVILPLWALGSGLIALGGAVAASPLMEGALGFLLRIAVLLGAFVLAVKAVFPDLPMKKVLNRRTLPPLLLCASALAALDGLLRAAWPDYAGARRIAVSAGALLATLAAAAAYAVREHRRRAAAPEMEENETPPPDRLYCTDPAGDFTLLLK